MRKSLNRAWLDHQLDRRPDLIIDGDICEFGHTTHKNAIALEISSCQYKGFDSLIDRSGANCLDFRRWCSRTIPAIAPATAAVRDVAETLISPW